MIRFDWGVLRKQEYNVILKVLSCLTYKVTPKDRELLEIIASMKDMSAFLVNPEGLLNNRKSYSHYEVFYYLEVAAYRSYLEYMKSGTLYVPSHYIKKSALETLSKNRLLIVTDDKISLKYEEMK